MPFLLTLLPNGAAMVRPLGMPDALPSLKNFRYQQSVNLFLDWFWVMVYLW